MAEWGFSEGGPPIVVGHRGDPRRHPENTLPGFVSALAEGAEAVEFDVRMTADGQPVVIHDADVARNTDGEGLVGNLTLAEVRRLRVFGPGEPGAIPTLAETLEAVGAAGGGADVEIKPDPGDPAFEPHADAALRSTLHELERTGFPGPALISSFDPRVLLRCRELAPGIPTGLLTIDAIDPMDALAAAREAGYAFILPAVAALDRVGESLVKRAHEAGVAVGTWTVDQSEMVGLLLSMGVDAIATNDPAMAVAARRDLEGRV